MLFSPGTVGAGFPEPRLRPTTRVIRPPTTPYDPTTRVIARVIRPLYDLRPEVLRPYDPTLADTTFRRVIRPYDPYDPYDPQGHTTPLRPYDPYDPYDPL